MHTEGPGPNDTQLLADAAEDYRLTLCPLFEAIFVVRGPNRLKAIQTFQKAVISTIAGCRRTGENNLDYAKSELLKQEHSHPAWQQNQDLHESLSRAMMTWRSYKVELQKLLNPEEFAEKVEEIEGVYKAYQMISMHRMELRSLLDEEKRKSLVVNQVNPV